MSVISIIKSTNNYIADRVFAGVYGTRQEIPAAEEGQAPTSVFTIAPEFRNVSQLFTYLENGSSPVAPGEFIDIEVDDAQASPVRNQLLYSLKLRWKSMYEGMLGQRSSDMLTTMLTSESRMVDSAIDARFASFGLRTWSVPVKATMRTIDDGAMFANESDLLLALGKHGQDITILDEEEVVTAAAREETANLAPITDAATTMGVTQEGADQTPQWQDYAGIDVEVKGHIVVVAESPAAAKTAAVAMIALSQREEGMFAIQVEPVQILYTRPAEFADHVIDAADSEEINVDDLADDIGDGMSDHYRF